MRRSASADQLGGELRGGSDDDRVVVADDLLERALGVDVDVEARAKKLDAGVGDLFADEDFHVAERFERRRDRDAALDVRAEVGEDDLHCGELRRDVEDVEPADVAEPEDLALQRALAVRDRDAEPVAEGADELGRVDSVGRTDGGDDGAPVLVRGEELEAERLHSRARGAAEPDVTLEDGVETLLGDETERDVEPADERDRQRHGRIELLLPRARPLPVEVEARRGARRRERSRRDRGERRGPAGT